ncbi:MAG TPA: hypothetical protein VIL74_07125 [Pyrinomonadaceae bacterium]|jgi:hypothetical protein
MFFSGAVEYRIASDYGAPIATGSTRFHIFENAVETTSCKIDRYTL